MAAFVALFTHRWEPHTVRAKHGDDHDYGYDNDGDEDDDGTPPGRGEGSRVSWQDHQHLQLVRQGALEASLQGEQCYLDD